ncbi:uncharacterized protein LOC105157949 [Sesamum indicum]|uniref:Uncharacterized protein LOC105157949 n=1 Tax=Sesamum indicum TaxID=4182 RepID=A0A6I9SYI9_SESIN|nr:uncharacterized protein LOC105157949 [Sesamum indicum]
MVVDPDLAVAAAGEVAELPLPFKLRWDNIHPHPLDAAASPPPKPPWSMVAIRKVHQDHGCDNPPIVFPPINHENLLISPDLPPTPDRIPRVSADIRQSSFSESDSDSDYSNSSSAFTPSDSSSVPRSPVFRNARAKRAADAVGWFDSWAEILQCKVIGLVRFLCSSFTYSRVAFLTFRSTAFTAILIAFLYFRRRRRLRDREENMDRLIGIIKERDEKINQLLHQISRMNQMLLAVHKAPSSPTP